MTNSIRYKIKKIVCLFFYYTYRTLCFITPGSNKVPSLDAAKKIIEKNDYHISEIDETLPELNVSIIDLSIIVPIYNSEKYLRKCLNSLLNQKTDYKYEIICIVDGCTDNSKQIVTEMSNRHEGMIVIHEQSNQGISSARNKGLELAKGRYIGFVDNDDFVDEDYVAKMMRAIIQNDADMVQVGHEYVDECGNPISRNYPKETIVLNNDGSIDYISKLYGFVWGAVFRKNIFEKVRFNKGYWYEDMITKMLLGRLSKKTVVLPYCLYHYTMHNNNASKRLWKTSSIKTLDSVFLPMALFKYSKDILQLKQDNVINSLVIHELCWQFPNRALHLPHKIKKAAFSIIQNFIITNNIIPVTNEFHWLSLHDYVINGSYYKWIYLAYAEKWKSKLS